MLSMPKYFIFSFYTHKYTVFSHRNLRHFKINEVFFFLFEERAPTALLSQCKFFDINVNKEKSSDITITARRKQRMLFNWHKFFFRNCVPGQQQFVQQKRSGDISGS